MSAATWEERKPGDAKVTPAMESAQRGKDEDYAQAVGQIFGDAFDKKTGMFVSGKSYLDCWTAVHNYAEWIQESIAKLQKL